MVIGETLCRVLDKLVIRAAGYQAKTACGNLQLYVGLEAIIGGETHAAGQRILERDEQRRSVDEARTSDEDEDEDKAAR